MQLFDTSRLEVRDLWDPRTIEVGEDRVLSSLPPLQNLCESYLSLPLIHATTAERAMSIIRDGHILSHRKLAERWEPFLQDTKFINTDELDKILGLDRFVFLSLWRMAPRIFDLSDDIVIFLIDPGSIDPSSWAFYSLREVCEFWATVSQEWAHEKQYSWVSDEAILAWNIEATQEFYDSLVSSERFWEFFDRFILRFWLSIIDYLATKTYPWEEEEIVVQDWLNLLLNYWQGFQCMVPDRVKITTSVKVICTSAQTRRNILSLMPAWEVTTVDFLRKQLPPNSMVVNERFISLISTMWHNGQLQSLK